jgi:hypothetical protein
MTGTVMYASYGYNVTEWVAIVFVAVFGLSCGESLACYETRERN